MRYGEQKIKFRNSPYIFGLKIFQKPEYKFPDLVSKV